MDARALRKQILETVRAAGGEWLTVLQCVGGKRTLRVRAYPVLRSLVADGLIRKTGKTPAQTRYAARPATPKKAKASRPPHAAESGATEELEHA